MRGAPRWRRLARVELHYWIAKQDRLLYRHLQLVVELVSKVDRALDWRP